MTEKAFPRQRFDRELTFVVNKPITLSGKTTAPGTIFDKSLVTGRKLQQLFEQRYLRFADVANGPIFPREPSAENRAGVRTRALSRPRA